MKGNKQFITVEVTVYAPLEQVWKYWNEPEHITGWYFASDDWEAPAAENDLRTRGKFKIKMSAKNKSESFEFSGIYTDVKEHERIEYDLDDGRHVKIDFLKTPEGIKIIETFEPEHDNTEALQRSGWQEILNNFKKYTEAKKLDTVLAG